MRFVYWSREIAGWAVLLIGLALFYATYDKLVNRRIFEAAPMAFMGFVVFRGGIHLLKVAVAAQAARALPESGGQPATRKASRLPAKSYAPTPTKAVVPGPRGRSSKAERNGDDED